MKKIKTIIYKGKKTNAKTSLEDIVTYLQKRRSRLHEISSEDLIDYFNKLSVYWSNHDSLKHSIYSRNLIEFIQKDNLSKELEIALRGDYRALDMFVTLSNSAKHYHAQPRGLVVQWLAGNVPTLGIFSIVSAILTKNVTLVKASSKGYQDLVSLLMTLSEVNTKKIKGSDILKNIAVVLLDHDDTENLEYMSLSSDVRIAWGGHEAIQTIVNLPKNTHTEDIVFGPKYSFSVIDRHTLENKLQDTAQKAAIDVSVFDQYACSSPHTIFVQEGSKVSALDFAKLLAKKLDLVHRTLIPKNPVGSGEATDVIKFRAEYVSKGVVFQSKGTEWTVLYSKDKGLFEGCFSRVVAIRPIKDISEIAEYVDRGKQSLGVGMIMANKQKYLDKITLSGIDRCPDLGYMTFFESPWDGMFVFDRLVRWVYFCK